MRQMGTCDQDSKMFSVWASYYSGLSREADPTGCKCGCVGRECVQETKIFIEDIGFCNYGGW